MQKFRRFIEVRSWAEIYYVFQWNFRHTSSKIRFVNLRDRVFFPKDME